MLRSERHGVDNPVRHRASRCSIVDDHAVVRSGLTAFLSVYDDLELVGEAAGGAEAVEICASRGVDVVLMDLVMPGMDGAAATKAIREQCPQTQVLALTSFKEDDLVQGALQAGAIGYLLKNISGDELAAAIRAAYAGRPTLAPEATQALIHVATQPKEEPIGADLTKRETRDAPHDGRGPEQPRHRAEAVPQPLDGEVPREQHPDETGRDQPYRGGLDRVAERVGLTVRPGRAAPLSLSYRAVDP